MHILHDQIQRHLFYSLFLNQRIRNTFFLILSFITMSARESLHSDQADRDADNQIKQTAFHL